MGTCCCLRDFAFGEEAGGIRLQRICIDVRAPEDTTNVFSPSLHTLRVCRGGHSFVLHVKQKEAKKIQYLALAFIKNLAVTGRCRAKPAMGIAAVAVFCAYLYSVNFSVPQI